MKSAPRSAARKRSGWKTCSKPANAVPTSTGATAAGSVRGREAINQIRIPLIVASVVATALHSGPAGELGEVRTALLQVGVAPLLGLLAHVEEEVGVVGQLLDAGEPVLVGVEAGLEQPEGEGRQGEHLPAPLHRLLLKALEGDDGVDEAHLEPLLRVVLAAEEPDLLRLLGSD